MSEGPDISAVKARLEAAERAKRIGRWCSESYSVDPKTMEPIPNTTTYLKRDWEDFIAHAPSDIASLLEALEAAERRVAEAVDWFMNNHEAINGAIVFATMHGSPYRGKEAPEWMQAKAIAAGVLAESEETVTE